MLPRCSRAERSQERLWISMDMVSQKRDLKADWSLDDTFAIHLPLLSMLLPVEGKNQNTRQTSSARTGKANDS